MLNSIGERTEPCGTQFFGAYCAVHRWCVIRSSGLTTYPCVYPGWSYAASGGVHGAPRYHIQLSSPETLPQHSRCAESCIRCLVVLIVLLGPPFDLSRRKPACSRGSCGSITGSIRLSIPLQNLEPDAEQ